MEDGAVRNLIAPIMPVSKNEVIESKEKGIINLKVDTL